ncbi:MAG: HlyC/CorC family transporter [Leptospiraceae bacterium]|nr:HlyC/CorC family transporter [Leptospiraceae bacterium]
MELLFLYLFVAIFFSFFCSLLESTILSVTPAYISIKIEEGKKSGHELQKLKENIDRPLAAILTLNTFANTLGAAGVGAQAQVVFGNQYLSLISVLLTLTILIISEIIPKTLGANYWKTLAPMAAAILKVLIYSPLYPAILVSQYLTGILKSDTERSSVLSKADFAALAKISAREGMLKQEEFTIIQNLLRFNSFKAEDVMTPRNVLHAAPEDISLKKFYETTKNNNFSRIPIYTEDIDHITGYILMNDLLNELLKKDEPKQKNLKDISRKILVVYKHLPIPRLFNKLLTEKEHIALVTDEYGGTVGIVTMEDIMEALLGLEIMDELDNIEDMQSLARKERRNKLSN